MGFITGNTNSFEVFLTDYGLQTFYRGGLKNDSILFSVTDDDANYLQLAQGAYDPINVFNNPTNNIRTIQLNPITSGTTVVTSGTTTYLDASGFEINGQNHVFTQTNKRGGVLDGKLYRKPLLTANEPTLKNYVGYEGDLTTDQDFSLLTYRKINNVRQFHIKGVNGLYLTYNEAGFTEDNLMYDVDAYPQSTTDLDFSYINARFGMVDKIKFHQGSNDTKKLNRTVPYSSITRSGYLILNEKYDIEFDLRFTFFTPEFAKITNPDDRTIKITADAILGKNKVAMDIFTPGTGSETVLGTKVLYMEGSEVDTALAEIIDDNKTLFVKDVIKWMPSGSTSEIARQGYVRCRIKGEMCKKNKDLTIVINYGGKFGGFTRITIMDSTNSPSNPGSTTGGSTYDDSGEPTPTGGGGSQPTCLLAGTQIQMADGSFKIVDDLSIGDTLASLWIKELDDNREDDAYLKNWSANTITTEPSTTQVKAHIRRTIDGMFCFNGVLKTSSSHIHFTWDPALNTYQYKTAAKVRVGEFLVRPDGSLEKIVDIQLFPGMFIMYQVDTEIYENFFADGYVTHNKMAPKEPGLVVV